MGNTRAWPVLHTTDLNEAWNLATALLKVATWYDAEGCHLHAWANTDDELRRLTQTHPAASVQPYGRDGATLPASLHLAADASERSRENLRAWADITSCYILWHDMKWPAVPELGLEYEEYKYAELEIACHSHDIHCEEWTPDHTVFIHARPGEDARAAWLAARVGAEVVGPPEFGW
ncbi:hypothetical protein ABZ614_26495 [Streptomyces sp. NPDC013178]|uniref:hypothetical protein n=1 Tax=unclassified Streptomyces TaxID=2593676 RepID=UPI0033D58C9A